VFLEDGRFFDKNMCMRAECFLENRRFFTKYGHESKDFFVKKRGKKDILLSSWAHNIVWF